jgi:hypothetical protein
LGSISAFVLVIGYLLTFPLYAWVGNAPSSGIETKLIYFAEHAAGWWAILGLMVFTDLLLIPIFLSLYQALKKISINGMLLAAACEGLFVILDLAITWMAYSALITSGGNYAAATTNAQRELFIADAGYPSAMLASPLLRIYAIVLPSLGTLFTGLVMIRSIFNKPTAYLALAVGVSGIIYLGSYVISGLDIVRIINALLVTVWYAFVGYNLFRLGQR